MSQYTRLMEVETKYEHTNGGSTLQAVQNLQGPEVYLHADGGVSGRRALDHSQGQR